MCSGCGATGLAWVGEAHLQSTQQLNQAQLSNSRASAVNSIPATTEQSASEARPRLSHTVTLGEIDVVTSQAGAGAGVPGPAVIVNNYNQVNLVTPAFGYGNYGYWRASPGFSPGRVSAEPVRPRASGPQPGQDWPAVADHGPSFPYKSAPASPWTRPE